MRCLFALLPHCQIASNSAIRQWNSIVVPKPRVKLCDFLGCFPVWLVFMGRLPAVRAWAKGARWRCCTENFKSEVWALSPGSCGFLGGTDGIRATDPKHAIQNRDADGGFGLLTCKGPCPKLRANNPFVSAIVVPRASGGHSRSPFAIPVALWPRSRRYGPSRCEGACPASSLKPPSHDDVDGLLNGIIVPRRGRRSATKRETVREEGYQDWRRFGRTIFRFMRLRAKTAGRDAQVEALEDARVLFAIEPCLIGMEACGSAHYWGRELKRWDTKCC